MKKTILIVLMLCVFASCHDTSEQKPKSMLENPQMVEVVIEEDYSESVKKIIYSTPDFAHDVYFQLAKRGGVVKHIGIYDETTEFQNIYTMTVDRLDTISLEGETNIYQLKKKCNQNDSIKKRHSEVAKDRIAKYLTATDHAKDYKYTYIQPALELGRLTLESQIYATGYRKYLLILSDLINSVRPNDKNKKLRPVELTNTIVLIVRPSLSGIREPELKALFPNSQVFLFTDINDALTMISK